MVNPLMSSKQEPFTGISDVLGASSSTSVKLELDPSENGDEDDSKIEVKMEVLEEFFGLGFGGGNMIEADTKEALIGSDNLLLPINPPTYQVSELNGACSSPLVKTVKVPLPSEMSEGPFPPVLSIPCSVSTVSGLTSPISAGGLHIAVSPSQGPDTTTLTSPPPSSVTPTSLSSKKTIFTAKGLIFSFIIHQRYLWQSFIENLANICIVLNNF